MRQVTTNKETDNVGEILSIRPDFPERAAMPLFTLILLTICTICHSIHYPDILKVRAVIVDSNVTAGFSVEITVPGENLPEMNTGLPIQFNFDAYPSARYGSVRGVLQYIYNREGPGDITVKVTFPNGFTTSRGETIPYSTGLKSEAYIQLNDMRLLQHLFYSRSR